MSEILRQWISDDVGVHVQSLEEELASGYVLGQILSKLNLQPDFEQFDATGTPDAMINNYTRLQPTLKHLGIKLDAPRANAMMREEKGVAAQMIYDIRAAVKEHSRTLQSSYAPPMGQSLGMKSELNRTLLEARHHRQQLRAFEFFQGEHFEDVIRKHAKNPKSLKMEMHTLPFANEGARQAAIAEQSAAAAAAAAQAKRSDFRSSRLARDKAMRVKAADFDKHVSNVHAASQERHAAMHAEDARVQQSLAQKAAARKQLAQAATALDVSRNIDEFEEKLARMAVRGPGVGGAGGGKDTGPTSPTIKASDALPPVGKTPYDQIMRIKQFLPDQDLLKLEAQEYMRRMHERRKAEIEGVKQREVRRRRLLMEADAALDAEETAGRLSAVVEGLQRQSREEQRIAARLKQLAKEEDVLISNRNQRMAQYTERRERDWAEAIAREVELSQALKAQVADEVERERREWRRAQARRREEKAAKHELMARAVVRDAVGVALLHAVHREQCGLDAPPKVVREWVAMFHAQDVRLRSADEQIEAEAAEIIDHTMDGAALLDYLHGEGEWSPAALSATAAAARPGTAGSRPGSGQPAAPDAPEEAAFAAVGFNEALAASVHAVRERVEPPPQDAAPALDLPVRIAVVGGPFCGKTTLAQGLVEAYGAAILDAEALVTNALQAAGVYLDPGPQIVEEEVPCSSGGEDPGSDGDAAATAAVGSQDGSAEEVSGAVGPKTVAAGAESSPPVAEATPGDDAGSSGDVTGVGDGGTTASMADSAEGTAAKAGRTKLVRREIPPPPPPQQVVIGRRAQEALLDGQQLSDADTAALVADAIWKLQEGYHAWRASPDESGAPAVDDTGKPTHPQGFILDGFPRTEQQAKELEKALTGLDVAAEEAYAAGASIIAPPGAAAFLSPTRPIKSCLDTVVVLELENSEVAVERAVGRRMDPETGKIYHMQLSPPPGDAPGLLERLIPVTSQSNDTEQLQKRLQVHVDTAPGLRTWLRRFDRLVWMVSADVPPGEVLAEVQTIAAMAREGKEAAAQCAAAAHTAQAARATAEVAQARAEEAMHAASAAARELLLAKRAEVEAEALVRKPATPDPKAGKGAKKDAAPVEMDPEVKRAQDAAAALLAEQAGARCAEHLQEAERASQEARVRAEEAAAAASAAADACTQARRSAHDAAKSREAEERAAAAAEAAEVARAATEAAAETAAASAASAAATVARAQAQAAGPAEELPTPAELVAPAADPGLSAEASAATGVSGQPSEQPPEAVQASCPLDTDSARFLHELWTKMEATYMRGGKLAFAGMRRLRASVLERLHAAQVQFAAHLQRPDQRQAELTEFQVQFNSVDLDLLRLPEVKAELALQVDELRDRLWKICDDKLADSTKLHSELTDPALEDTSMMALSAGYAALVQAEVARFKAAAAFARDHAVRCAGLPPLGVGFTHTDVLAGDVPSLAPFMPAPGTCEWASVEGLEQLAGALRCACAMITQDERDTIAAAVDAATEAAQPAAKKGGKGAPVPPVEPALPPAATAAAATAAAARERVGAADAAVAPVLARERDILTQRLRAIAARARSAAAELHSVVAAVSERMASLMHERFRTECATVASVTMAAAEAVRAGEPLPHVLTITDSEAIVDESSIIVPQPPRKAAAAPPPKPLAPGLLSVAQLVALVRAARVVTTSEFITTRDAADLLQALSAVRGDAPEAFPPEWQRATWKQMHDALAEMDSHASGYVDWLEVTASLVLHACPQIAEAAPTAFAAAAAALAAADGDGDGAVTQQEWEGCRLWFEAQRRQPGCEEDLEAANALVDGGQEPPPDGHLAGVKQLLWEMFWEDAPDAVCAAAPGDEPSETAAKLSGETLAAMRRDEHGATPAKGDAPEAAADGPEPPSAAVDTPAEDDRGSRGPTRRLSITRMLLYLCADKELPLAVHKAFAVLGRDPSPRATLPAAAVVRLLYPSGTAAGAHIFKVPYPEEEVVEMLQEARPRSRQAQEAEGEGGEQPAQEVLVTADNLVYSMAGARLLAACGQRYHLRDVFLDCWRVMPGAE